MPRDGLSHRESSSASFERAPVSTESTFAFWGRLGAVPQRNGRLPIVSPRGFRRRGGLRFAEIAQTSLGAIWGVRFQLGHLAGAQPEGACILADSGAALQGEGDARTLAINTVNAFSERGLGDFVHLLE